MNVYVNKSYTLIGPSCAIQLFQTSYLSYSLTSFMLDASHFKVVDMYKYLGHIISTVSDDNDDILNQTSLFYTRANVLLHRFGECNISVKLCLFKTYCTQFYDIALSF